MVLDGEPVAKLRHRRTRTADGRWVSYTPAKTRTWERQVALQGQVAAAGRGCPWRGALAVEMRFVLEVPRSWPTARREAALGAPHAKGPDLSNLAKSVEDGLNGVVWGDDRQIADLRLSKRYGPRPGVRVGIGEA